MYVINPDRPVSWSILREADKAWNLEEGEVDEEFLHAISRPPALEKLTFDISMLCDPQLSQLSTWNQLVHLESTSYFETWSIHPPGLQKLLSNSRRLKSFRMTDCGWTRKFEAKHGQATPSYRAIHSFTLFSGFDAGIKSLAWSLTQSEELKISALEDLTPRRFTCSTTRPISSDF